MIPYHRGVPSIWFRISFARNAFLRFLGERGLELATLGIGEGVEAMVAFHEERRAQHTDLDAGGDGLLVEWWNEANGWTFSLVRRLQRSGDDQPIHQLALRFHLAGIGPEAGSVRSFDPARSRDDVGGLEACTRARRADIVHRELTLDTL